MTDEPRLRGRKIGVETITTAIICGIVFAGLVIAVAAGVLPLPKL